MKEPILVRNKFLILTNEFTDIFKFSISSRGSGLHRRQPNCRAYYHGSLSTSVLEEIKGQVNYLNSKGIKAASIGKGKLCKWRLEVVSFISIRATWYSRSHFIKRYFS